MTSYVRMMDGGSLHLEPVHWDLLKTQQRLSFQLIQQEAYGILFALGSHAAKISKFYIQPNHQTSCWKTQISYLPKNLATLKLTAVTKFKLIFKLNYFKKLHIKLSDSTKLSNKKLILEQPQNERPTLQ